MEIITQVEPSPILTQNLPPPNEFIGEIRTEVFGLLTIILITVGGAVSLWIFIRKMT